MTDERTTRNLGRALWVALGCTIAVLIALAYLNEVLSTGWRLYVLGRALHAAWAATAAVMVGTAAAGLLNLVAGERGAQAAVATAIFEIVRVFVVLSSVLGALSYFMPDWTPLSTVTAAFIILLWILAGLGAMATRA